MGARAFRPPSLEAGKCGPGWPHSQAGRDGFQFAPRRLSVRTLGKKRHAEAQKRQAGLQATPPSRLLRPSNALAIFARRPIPGKTKTRLIPLLGRVGAADFQAALIQDTTRKVVRVTSRSGRLEAYVFLPGSPRPPRSQTSKVWARRVTSLCAGPEFMTLPQQGRGLGARLDHAFRTLLHRHASAVIIGTDSPRLAPRTLRVALRELRVCDAVLGPCPDGGYYLVGLAGRARAVLGRRGVFARVRWGTADAFRDTLRNLLQRGLSCSILEPVDDVDRPRDLLRLRRELARRASERRLAPATWRFVRTRVGLAAHA